MPSETSTGSGLWRVMLGSVTFKAIGGNPGDSATFQAVIPDLVSTSEVKTWDSLYGADPTYEVLANSDGPINSLSVTFNITATGVPLPSAIWGGAALLAVLAGIRLFRRPALA